MKKLALFLFGLGTLMAVSINAANISSSGDPVPQCQETTQATNCYSDTCVNVPCNQVVPCNTAPCTTDTVCNPAPCAPAPCNVGC